MDIFDGSAYETSHENGDIVLRQFFHSAQEACQVNKIQENSILLNSYGFKLNIVLYDTGTRLI